MQTITNLVNKVQKSTKDKWPSILQQWNDDILDEVVEKSYEDATFCSPIEEVVKGIKEQVN